ncbi:winged helix-turn-helix domain-containing protein [Patescibacteria group bacterium]|nr:winged helix-turn-helix domain-containing protein [Patescibacteria group bacterium]MBU1867887.1 winged helix-turn-helix domain-containing protein [Patescibacteria group bacterium]
MSVNDKLLSLFTSRVRVKILHLFFKQRKPIYVRQICRYTGEEINAVRRELNRLKNIGLLTSSPKGNRLYYQLDRSFEFYPEILRLVAKTLGVGKAIIERANDLGNITFAMLAQPFIDGRQPASHDVDLLIVGRVRVKLLEEIIRDSESEHQREINYSVMTVAEFDFRKKRNDSFILKVLAQPQIMLIGNEQGFNE